MGVGPTRGFGEVCVCSAFLDGRWERLKLDVPAVYLGSVVLCIVCENEELSIMNPDIKA